MSTRRELGKLIKQYRHKGWAIEPTHSGHWKFYPPGQRERYVVSSGSPGNVSAINNIKADLKRCERQR